MNEEKLVTGFQRISHAHDDTWHLISTSHFSKKYTFFSIQGKISLPKYFMTYDIKSSIATKSLCDTTKYACEGG